MDYIAALLDLIQLYLLGLKNKYGFIVGAMANIAWVVYMIMTNSTYGLLLITIPAFFLNVINFYKWKKNLTKE
jgi:hypothetical protein